MTYLGSDVEAVRRVSFRLEYEGRHVGSCFVIRPGLAVGCAHSIPSVADTVVLVDPDSGRTTTCRVLEHVLDVDVFVASTPVHVRCLPDRADVAVGELFYSWGYPKNAPNGDSLSVQYEGPSTAPYQMKLKHGNIVPGFSGAPLASLADQTLVGMVARTRSRGSDLGGRAVSIGTVLDVVASVLEPERRLSVVGPGDLGTVLTMLEAAYRITQPTLAFDPSLAQVLAEAGGQAAEDLRQIEGHDEARRQAAMRWHRARPDCFRFILGSQDGVYYRVGATCVLPLTKLAYRAYSAGEISEFSLDESCLVPDGASEYICVQSFGFVGTLRSGYPSNLREALVDHVRSMAPDDGPIHVIAETGTHAGYMEADYFGLKYCGMSYNRRPLLERVFMSGGAGGILQYLERGQESDDAE